jgi:hypothetical protein
VDIITDQVVYLIEEKIGKDIPSVEQIQDAIEEALIKG